ncbi:gluconate 2-dehydrogenase subunit 3 family protein [Snuella lapsa]
MDRRSLLKALPLSVGGLVATPTLLQLLSSCAREKQLEWIPKFLNKSQAYVLEQIVQVILPTTDEVGALDVKAPQFIDLILSDVVSNTDREVFIKGETVFRQKYEARFKKDISNASVTGVSIMVSTYFDLSEEDQEKVAEMLSLDPSEISDSGTFYIYKYLCFIRYYTLFAYLTAQEVKENLLGFNPYLGTYTACTTL